MSASDDRSEPPYRRRIFVVGLGATTALCAVATPFYVNGIEDDLERRVPAELAEAGFAGISATFSGQDGTLTCARRLDDPDRALAVAFDVWGVHDVTLDRVCRVETFDPAADDGSSDANQAASGDAAFTTVAELLAADSRLSYLSVLFGEAGLDERFGDPDGGLITLFAPSESAFDALPADLLAQIRGDSALLARVLNGHATNGAVTSRSLESGVESITMLDQTARPVTVEGGTITIGGAHIVTPDLIAGNGIVHIIDNVILPADLVASTATQAAPAAVTVSFDGTSVGLTGVVASEVERAALLNAVGAAGAAGADQLTVDPAVGLGAAGTQGLSTLVTAMLSNLVSGVAGFDGSALYVTGVYRDEVGRDAVLAAAQGAGAGAQLDPVPQATVEQAEALEAALNEFVATNPIQFEPGLAVLSDSAGAVLDEIAAQASQLSGVVIAIDGHTDSDGDPDENQVLSERRARAVLDALAERGIAAESMRSAGFGSTVPVLVDGVEDKAASRRVEFRIEPAA